MDWRPLWPNVREVLWADVRKVRFQRNLRLARAGGLNTQPVKSLGALSGTGPGPASTRCLWRACRREGCGCLGFSGAEGSERHPQILEGSLTLTGEGFGELGPVLGLPEPLPEGVHLGGLGCLGWLYIGRRRCWPVELQAGGEQVLHGDLNHPGGVLLSVRELAGVEASADAIAVLAGGASGFGDRQAWALDHAA